MSKIYMAVTVCQDKNETTLPREHTRNAAPVLLLCFAMQGRGKPQFALDCIGGLQVAHLCSPKKRGGGACNRWNDAYKANGEYLFDSPAF